MDASRASRQYQFRGTSIKPFWVWAAVLTLFCASVASCGGGSDSVSPTGSSPSSAPADSNQPRIAGAIAYACSGTNDISICASDVDGKNAHVLVKGTPFAVNPVWDPAGNVLAFVCDFSSSTPPMFYDLVDFGATGFSRNRGGEICLMGPDGRSRTLTQTGGHAAAPMWSPDGTRIAFTVGIGPIKLGAPATLGAPTRGIYLVEVSSGIVKQLTDDGDFPAWSPDGRLVAFTTQKGGGGPVIAAVGSDGSGLRRITSTPGWDLGPAWSPDGRLLAFTRYTGEEKELWTIRGDGSDPKRLLSAPCPCNQGGDYVPRWSPEGSSLAVVSLTEVGGVEHLGIVIVGADGARILSLDPGGHPEGLLDLQPAWSPDGKWLAVGSFRDDKSLRLFLISPDGSNAHPVLSDASVVSAQPAWRP